MEELSECEQQPFGSREYPKSPEVQGRSARERLHRDLLAGELGPVLLRHPGLLKLRNLALLDLLELLPLRSDLGADDVALLEGALLARGDLVADLARVLNAQTVLLALALALRLLLLHLHLDDALELVALELGLLREAALLLSLLLLARLVKLRVDRVKAALLGLLLLARRALRSLHRPLRAQRVHLGGLVLHLLLRRAEARGLRLLLVRQALELLLALALALLLRALVLKDLLLLEALREQALLLDLRRRRVRLVHLVHEALRREALGLALLDLLLLQGVDLLQDEGPLLVAVLLLLHALGLAVLDLLDDHLGAAALVRDALLLALLVHLQRLQALDLHHHVQLALLLFLLLLDVPLLLDLGVADGDDLRVEHHLVHVLNVIHLLVQRLLGLLEHAVPLGALLATLVGDHRVALALLLKADHLLLAIAAALLALLILEHLLALDLRLLLLREQRRVVLDARELRGRDHHGLRALLHVLRLLTDLDRVLANDGDLLLDTAAARTVVAEQGLVDVGVPRHGPVLGGRPRTNRAGHGASGQLRLSGTADRTQPTRELEP